jgi:hypothetical protein
MTATRSRSAASSRRDRPAALRADTAAALVDALVRDVEHDRDGDDVGAHAPRQRVHLRQGRVVLAIEEELHHDCGPLPLAAQLDELFDVRHDLVEHQPFDLHHPRVVGGVSGVEREEHFARGLFDQLLGDGRGQAEAVGGDVVDDQATLVNRVDDLRDLAMEQRIATAGQAHGTESARRHLIEDLADARVRDLLFRPHVHLIAEVAIDVAAIREVELQMPRPFGRPPVDDGVDDRPLVVRRDLGPAVCAPHGRR